MVGCWAAGVWNNSFVLTFFFGFGLLFLLFGLGHLLGHWLLKLLTLGTNNKLIRAQTTNYSGHKHF